MDVQTFLDSHPYAATTKRTYADVLTQLFAHVEDPAALSASELLSLVQSKGWGNSRQCVALAASQKFLAWKYGQSHPALSARLKRIRGKMPRTLTQDIAETLLASFDRHCAKGARDLAIASLLIDTGLRESEICNLQQADTDTDKRILQALVKGGSWEFAIFSEETAAHIEHWKLFRQRLNPQGFLFVSTVTGDGLTPGGLYSIVREWGKTINITLGVHDFRRGFATIASEGGAPDRLIMEGGRWKSTQMVTRYTRALRLEKMRPWLPMTKLRR
jgi:integrase